MNPREFCQLPGFHSALFTSFTFDPFFFERLALPDLWGSGSSNILICADAKPMQQSIESWPGQIMHLGRRYQVAPIVMRGSFHPKMILKAGRESGAVWVGSANITFSGWGVNRELGTSWRLGPEFEDNGAWLQPLLQGLVDRGATGHESDVIERLLSQEWLAQILSEPDRTSSPVLSTFTGRTLGEQLEQRWAGRRFSEALICTGSTDTHGRFLQWLHITFGVTRATVITDPGRCAFDLEALKSLPIDIQVRALVSEQPSPMHAKFLWLDGQDGPATCFGSANCSSAAWLLPREQGGNDEMIVVYDQPDRMQFEDTLRLFQQDSVAVSTSPRESNITESARPAQTHHVVYSGWDPDTGRFIIRLTRPLKPGDAAALKWGSGHFPCVPFAEDPSILQAEFLAPRSEAGTLFAKFVVSGNRGATEEHLIWVNHFGDLRHASRGRGLADSLGGLANARTNAERHRYLKSLHQLSAELLTNSDDFRDPRHLLQVSNRKKEEPETETPSTPIDPTELIRSLRDIQLANRSKEAAPGFSTSLSLSGVFRMLFQSAMENSQDDEFDQPDDTDEPSTEDPSILQRPGTSDPARSREPSSSPRKPEAAEQLDDRIKARLSEQVEDFLFRLAENQFADQATATQLVQSIAYALGLSQIARRDGWASLEQTEVWARRVIDIAFSKHFGEASGLIGHVHSRYQQEGEADAFERIAGDGTLWAALLAVLSNLSWQGPGGYMEHALTLRRIFREKSLIASTDAGKLSYLVSHDQLLQLSTALEIAPDVDHALAVLEGYLKELESKCGDPLGNSPRVYEDGDVMWRLPTGWAICRQTSDRSHQYVPAYLQAKGKMAQLTNGWYWNVSAIARTDPTLSDHMIHLRSLLP